MAQPAGTNLLGDGRRIILDKASPIGTIGTGADPSGKFLQFASIYPENTYSAGICAHYFVFGEEPKFSNGEPLRANFEEAGDAIIFMYKSHM